MNKHLNYFRFYTGIDRNHQLENDLTRALAITLMENNLFLHEALKEILKEDFKILSNQDLSTSDLSISIQQNTKQLKNYDKVYAVSVSDFPLDLDNFQNLEAGHINDEITDMVIQINAVENTSNQRITIIFEVKRNSQNTAQQLFDQAISIFRKDDEEFDFQNFKATHLKNSLIGVDWNWKKVMTTAWRVHSFQQFSGGNSKILSDFIDLVRTHNISWLPQFSLNITPASSKHKIMERLNDAFREKYGKNRLIASDRLGITLPEIHWANELIVGNNRLNDIEPTITFAIYPGNTKVQGNHIFLRNDFPKIKNEIIVNNELYKIHKSYHIKFTAFQSYFTSIDFNENDLIYGKSIYTKANFLKIVGRRKRGNDNWQELQMFFDEYFKPEFD